MSLNACSKPTYTYDVYFGCESAPKEPTTIEYSIGNHGATKTFTCTNQSFYVKESISLKENKDIHLYLKCSTDNRIFISVYEINKNRQEVIKGNKELTLRLKY